MCGEYLIVDAHNSDMNRLAILRVVTGRQWSLAVLVFFTNDPDTGFAVECIREGASDFIILPIEPRNLLYHIQAALTKSSRHWIFNSWSRRIESRHAGLTTHEEQVMKLLVLGKHTKPISSDLSVSVKTIENHR